MIALRGAAASTHAPDHNAAPVETSAPQHPNELDSDAVTEFREHAAAEAASTPLRAALAAAKAETASERDHADTEWGQFAETNSLIGTKVDEFEDPQFGSDVPCFWNQTRPG